VKAALLFSLPQNGHWPAIPHAKLENLKQDRYHVWYVVKNVELSVDAHAIFAGLLADIDRQIAELEPRAN
jgi:hypothetical protein